MVNDSGAKRQILAGRAKNAMVTAKVSRRREEVEALPVQGQMMRASSPAADAIWAAAVCRLGSDTMKFTLNSATDTLPHNANLARWYGSAFSDQCRLCGRKQTLLHVLNNCKVALTLRRYNIRHDKTLRIITELAQSLLCDGYHLISDLGEEGYHFPSHIVPTNLRSDLVMWSDRPKKLDLFELRVCFETVFDDAARRKTMCYSELASDARAHGYCTTIIPIQIGSQGVVEESGLEDFKKCLKHVLANEWKSFLIQLVTITIEASHKIWCTRNRAA